MSSLKRMIKPGDARLKAKDRLAPKKKKAEDLQLLKTHETPQQSSALFFQYNTQLGPPYHILVDTNFVNFSIKNKLDIIQNMMDCLYAKCIPYITDCVQAELEKMGPKFKLALRIIKDSRFERITCLHRFRSTRLLTCESKVKVFPHPVFASELSIKATPFKFILTKKENRLRKCQEFVVLKTA